MTRDSEQETIRLWFDATYKEKGVSYLRPAEAYHIFLELLSVQPGKKILDIGCGPGLLLSRAREKGLKTYGADISFEALKMCETNVPQVKLALANAEMLPYPDNRFDYISCLGSLERFIDLEQSLSEHIRVAKEGARFCYMVRNADTFSWRFFMQLLGMQNRAAHQGAKTLENWEAIFNKAGFTIEKVYHDHWPFLRFLKWATYGGMTIDYGKVRKPLIPLRYAYEFIFILIRRPLGNEV